MYISKLVIPRETIQKEKITDSYSIHRLVYSCFEKTRESDNESSGILFVEKQGNSFKKEVLIVSKQEPRPGFLCEIRTKEIPMSFMKHSCYRFEIIINPVKRHQGKASHVLRTREDIAAWFIEKSAKCGFMPRLENLEIAEITVDKIKKSESSIITLCKARILGVLEVTDKEFFQKTLCSGIGKGKAFGCGLLQVQANNN